MAEDLEMLINKAQGEGPTPRFVAALRARIVAETAEVGETDNATSLDRPEVDETVTTVVELDLVPPSEPPVDRWRKIAVVAAVVVLTFGAFVVLSDSPTVTTTIGEPPSLAADAELMSDEFTNFEPGTYRVDTVGTPFTFTADQPRRVDLNSQGRITLTHIQSQASGDRVIAFMRLSGLSDPEEPTAMAGETGLGWPARDFDGWLDAASDWIVVSDRQETTLGGLDAVRADIELQGVDCDIDAGSCPLLGTNGAVHGWWLHPGWLYRVWIVEQRDEDPLAVVVSVNRASDRDWFDAADTILSSLAFGEVGPNPVIPASDGATELPFLGGIEVELPVGSFAVNEPADLGRVPFSDWDADTVFLADPRDLGGNRLGNIDDLVTALGAADVRVTEVEGATVDGINARSFEIATDGSQPTLRPSTAGEQTWTSPSRGRMWVVEHPDRGLLVMMAEVNQNIDLVFPLIVAETERLLRSLQFVNLD